MLEPYEGKLSRPVLRRGRASNRSFLFDITTREVRIKKQEISEEYQCNNLSIYLKELHPKQIEDTVNSESKLRFIKQLELVSFNEDVILQAKKDYCKAFLQRRHWIMNQEIFDDELSDYNIRLKEEWNENFIFMCNELESSCNSEDIKRMGRALYKETKKILPHLNIRERCNEPFIQRGSYEILSEKLEVGWHKDYEPILRGLSR